MTYSGIDVWEMVLGPHSVMRRRSDGWINATHILKVAGVEKGKRTKILEREVHHEPHEKIQGGFGKYQGTWVPVERGRQFAIQYQVESLLKPILDVENKL
ncbi:transcription regulator HTH, apses-type DNA-binding domain-containing protein [Gorgonomyces haynaldii]|nr:transcription regulator HTH, apses-type DNA-binding domain-containing protein [Gorgonomyces haynaldii]